VITENLTVDKAACCPEGPPPPEGPASDEEVARLAWALAHPARVRLLRILVERRACVCGELVDCMSLAQSTVSQHLKVLKESGLVRGEVDGPRTCYCVNEPLLARLKSAVSGL
jgi:ArsR family transcriptional regulator